MAAGKRANAAGPYHPGSEAEKLWLAMPQEWTPRQELAKLSVRGNETGSFNSCLKRWLKRVTGLVDEVSQPARPFFCRTGIVARWRSCVMGKRHRRAQNAVNSREAAIATDHGMLVPSSPEMQRPGIDAGLIMAIQRVDALIKDMREGLVYPSAPEDEDSAVKRYLLYISMLVDSVLPDIVMSAIAGNDVMVQLKVHILLEHSAKAVYYDDHSDYALYMMTVCEAWSIERKLEKATNNPGAVAQARAHHADMKAKFPVPKECPKSRSRQSSWSTPDLTTTSGSTPRRGH